MSRLLALCAGVVLLTSWSASCNRVIVDPVSPEVVAVMQLRNISEAEARAYVETGRYLPLVELRRMCPELISAELATGTRYGYKFKLNLNRFDYAVRARPLPESGCRRSFYSDNSRVIRQSWGPALADGTSAVLR